MKYITRSIETYTYYTGTFNPATMQVEDVKSHSFPYKLGARAKRDLIAENGPILSEEVDNLLYRMSLDMFVHLAELVTGDEVEAEEMEGEDDE